MSTRGNGRVFQRNGSPYWWIAYYHGGKEEREVAKHVRTGDKLEAIEEKKHEAERYLKRRLGEVIAEKHGGPSFCAPASQRLTVDDLMDALKADFELRGMWNLRMKSTFEKSRD